MIKKEIKEILRKHYVQIATELQELLEVEDIQAVADIELKYTDRDGNEYEIN